MTYSIGIDSGSTATKGILLADGVITRRFLVPTPFRPATAITEAWETLREGLETTPFLTLTGYGRQLVDFADKAAGPEGDIFAAHKMMLEDPEINRQLQQRLAKGK